MYQSLCKSYQFMRSFCVGIANKCSYWFLNFCTVVIGNLSYTIISTCKENAIILKAVLIFYFRNNQNNSFKLIFVYLFLVVLSWIVRQDGCFSAPFPKVILLPLAFTEHLDLEKSKLVNVPFTVSKNVWLNNWMLYGQKYDFLSRRG